MVAILKACIICNHQNEEDNFFSFRNKHGRMKMVTRKDVSEEIKNVAELFGFPRQCFSTHALRHAFGNQNKRVNNHFSIPSISDQNAQGGGEWTGASTTRDDSYAGSSFSDYSNLVALEMDLPGTLTTNVSLRLELPPSVLVVARTAEVYIASEPTPPLPLSVVFTKVGEEIFLEGPPSLKNPFLENEYPASDSDDGEDMDDEHNDDGEDGVSSAIDWVAAIKCSVGLFEDTLFSPPVTLV